VGTYEISRGATVAALGRRQAELMLNDMRDAVRHKDVGRIMDHISSDPDTRIAGLRPDQLRLIIGRAFHSSSDLKATYSNFAFAGDAGSATVEFDLDVTDNGPNMSADDYKGHITLRLKRADISHLFGLFHTREWRITAADTTGRDPLSFGDF
jgi:hypothetical protein